MAGRSSGSEGPPAGSLDGVGKSGWGVEMMELRQRIHAQDGGGEKITEITEIPINTCHCRTTMYTPYQSNSRPSARHILRDRSLSCSITRITYQQ